MVRKLLNGAIAVKAQCVCNCLAQKENGKKNATRDGKTSKASEAEL